MVRLNDPTDPSDRNPVIQGEFKKFLNDENALAAFRKVDTSKMHQAGQTCLSALTTHLNFMSYKNSLQAEKASKGALPPASETAYVQRAQQHLDVFMNWNAAVGQIRNTMAAAGADHAFERHKAALFWNTQHPPYGEQVRQLFTHAGMSAADIAHHQAWLKAHQWDALSFPGMGGTIAGMAQAGSGQVAALQRELAAVKQHGLSTIEGASTPQQAATAAIVISIVVVVAFCIVTVVVFASPVPCLIAWAIE